MPVPSSPNIDAARQELRLANGFAGLGSIVAVLTGLALRELASYAWSWEHAAQEWMVFGVMAATALASFGVSLGYSWRVWRRTGAVVAAAWWVAVMAVVMISLTVQAMMPHR